MKTLKKRKNHLLNAPVYQVVICTGTLQTWRTAKSMNQLPNVLASHPGRVECFMLQIVYSSGRLSRHKALLFTKSEVHCSQLLHFSTYAQEKVSEASVEHKGWGWEENWASQTKMIFLKSHHYRAGVQFSRDSIRAFKDRINIRENRGLWTV